MACRRADLGLQIIVFSQLFPIDYYLLWDRCHTGPIIENLQRILDSYEKKNYVSLSLGPSRQWFSSTRLELESHPVPSLQSDMVLTTL
jgi:hypothetical protein